MAKPAGASTAEMRTVEEQVAALSTMSPAQLRAEWRRLHRGRPIPEGLARSQLERSIAWRLQEIAFGGLPLPQLRELDRYAGQLETSGKLEFKISRQLKPGARLVRRWHGEVHVVTATDGSFEYEGRTYTSLTGIAREITGSAVSGPRFFGMSRPVENAS